MIRCANICCFCDAKTSCLLGGVLASFSTIYYFANGLFGLLDVYITHVLIDLWSFVLSLLCLFAAVIVLLGYQSNNARFIMTFVLLYGVCACFRAVYVANALIVWIRWSKTDWVESVSHSPIDDVNPGDPEYPDDSTPSTYEDDGVVWLRNSSSTCIANFWFLLICLVLDVWVVLGAIVWALQLSKASRKLARAAAAAEAGRRVFAVYNDPHQYSLGGEIYLPGFAAAAAEASAAAGKQPSSSSQQHQQQAGTKTAFVRENPIEKTFQPAQVNKQPSTVKEEIDVVSSSKVNAVAKVASTDVASKQQEREAEKSKAPVENYVVMYLPQPKNDAADLVLLGNATPS